MKGPLLLVVTMMAFLIGSIVLAISVWRSVGETAIGGHGWAALIIGVTISLVIGGGLMALVFISSRRGYDDDAY